MTDEWDLWYAYFKWSDRRVVDEVLVPAPQTKGRIEWAKVIAVPLYSVQSIDHVLQLLERVRSAKLPSERAISNSSSDRQVAPGH